MLIHLDANIYLLDFDEQSSNCAKDPYTSPLRFDNIFFTYSLFVNNE
jgi:hypothetical protein